MHAERLTTTDKALAKKLFASMALIFAEESEPLSDGYVERLLRKDDFFVIAALEEGQVIGGLIAHVLPMTRSQSSEILIYDVAVCAEHRRLGVGRMLISTLREAGTAIGIRDIFVLADNHDHHAIEFYRALGGGASSITLFLFSNQ